MSTTISTPVVDFRKFFVTAPAPAAYSTIAVGSSFSGDGTIELDTEAAIKLSAISFGKFLFFANGTAGSSVKCKLVGSQGLGSDSIPITLAALTLTLGTAALSTGELIASAIAVDGSLITVNEIVPADNNIQILKLDLMGVQAVKLVPGPVVSGTVTSINAALSGF